jgi:hypothetical protein
LRPNEFAVTTFVIKAIDCILISEYDFTELALPGLQAREFPVATFMDTAVSTFFVSRRLVDNL